MPLQFKAFPTGQLQANCYVVHDAATRTAALIDPGDRSEAVAQFVAREDLNVTLILATHAHFDHIFGVGYFKQRYPSAKTLCHEADVQHWAANRIFAPMFRMAVPNDFIDKPDGSFKAGDKFHLGEEVLEVIHTPGHTPGSVCFLSAENGLCFTGDTLFGQGIGRTDFPGGSEAEMKKSIAKLKKILKADCKVLCGHGGPENAARALRAAEAMV